VMVAGLLPEVPVATVTLAVDEDPQVMAGLMYWPLVS
jgi:hypothetical protein